MKKEIVDDNLYSRLFSGKMNNEALKTALDTRKFEIELYWKRATYFWAFIAVTFTAYFLILTKEGNDLFRVFTIIIATVGFFFSLGWYFVNRGSKFWQKNWEDHVSRLEQSIQGPLYSCVKIPDKPFKELTADYPFSVLKVNQILSLIVTLFWYITLIFSVFYCFKINYYAFSSELWIAFVIPTILLLGLSWIFKYKSHSFLKKDEYNIKANEKNGKFFLTKPLIINSSIIMGNDEFILYIRKKSVNCTLTNDQLSKLIWNWLRENGAKKIEDDKLSKWSNDANNKDSKGLPQTAAQFEFDRAILSKLYCYLDELACL